MKKFVKYMKMTTITVMAATILMTIAPQDACAQMAQKQQKQLQKALNKEYKSKMAEYQKEGWKLDASSRTLEVSLLTHYSKLAEDENNKEFFGAVSQCQSINVCRQFALNNAINRYATLASGDVKGRIDAMMRADASAGMSQVEMDKFIAAYENMVQAEVGGVLTESYSIVKDKGNTKEYRTYFILNDEKARAARNRALERSLVETKMAAKEAEEISRFVNEGFNLD